VPQAREGQRRGSEGDPDRDSRSAIMTKTANDFLDLINRTILRSSQNLVATVLESVAAMSGTRIGLWMDFVLLTVDG
jgi:hypothetical protein